MTELTDEAVKTLLPCPFCGGAAKMHRQRDSFGTLNLSIANISCDRGCVHQSGYRETDVSIAAWNRRIPALVIATGRDTDAAVEALRADAQAAVALVLEQAGLAVANVEIGFHDGISGEWHPMAGPSIISAACAAIRSLAPADGLAAVEALRAERDAAIRRRDSWRDDYKALAAAIVGDTGLSAMTVATQARLFRLRAEAAEAHVAALTARLVGALHEARDAAHSVAHSEFDGVWSDQDFREFTPLADAALAEVQADARREGGE